MLELSRRVDRAISPFMIKNRRTNQPGMWCYGPAVASSFLLGCPTTTGCSRYKTLESAQEACTAAYDCGGLTGAADGSWYELRSSSTPASSPFNEQAWPRRPCNDSHPAVAQLPKGPRAPAILRAFFGAVEGALADPQLRFTGPDRLGMRETVREDDSIFVGLAAYRDSTWYPPLLDPPARHPARGPRPRVPPRQHHALTPRLRTPAAAAPPRCARRSRAQTNHTASGWGLCSTGARRNVSA